MQEEILKSSQESFANHVDQKIAKKQKKNGTNVKKFDENDLVIPVREVGSKLDYKWKGPFRVIKKVFANVYGIEDLRQMTMMMLMLKCTLAKGGPRPPLRRRKG
jgi:hypothetical protein